MTAGQRASDAIDRAAWLAERSRAGRIASTLVAVLGAAVAASRINAWVTQMADRARRTPASTRVAGIVTVIAVAIASHLVIARSIPAQDRTPPALSAAILLCAILAAIAATARSR